MQDVRTQLKGLQSRLPGGAAAVAQAAQELDKKIQAAENVLVEFRITSSEDSLAYPLALDGKLSVLASTVQGSADAAPTEADHQVFEELSRKLDQDLSRWGGILTTDLAAFQRLTSQNRLQTIVVKPLTGTAAPIPTRERQ